MITQKSSCDALMERYNQMTNEEREQCEVLAVSLGAPVTFSSYCNDGSYYAHNNPFVDNTRGNTKSWKSQSSSVGEWIQVNQEYPKLWTAVIIQGGGNGSYWVK